MMLSSHYSMVKGSLFNLYHSHYLLSNLWIVCYGFFRQYTYVIILRIIFHSYVISDVLPVIQYFFRYISEY